MKAFTFLMFAVLLLTSSCATIIRGSRQDVSFTSTPSGAKVLINGMDRGVTPTIINLDRKNTHLVKLQLDGYSPYESIIKHKVDGAIIGNIIFGGPLGAIIDIASGAWYVLVPNQVLIELKQEGVNQ